MPRPKKEKPNHCTGLYEIKITIGRTLDGKLIRKSFYSPISKTDARRQAEEWKIQQEVSNRTGAIVTEKSTTFASWAMQWLESIKGTVKDSTYQLTYVNSVQNHLIPYFGQTELCNIKRMDIQTFFNIKAKTYSKETLKKLRMCLFSLLDNALDSELIYRNPCQNIRLNGQESAPKSIYTQEQVNLVIDYAKSHRFGLEIIFLLTYGLRRGELLGIRWEDIDFDYKILHIQRAVADVKNPDSKKMQVIVDVPKTAFSIRDLPLTDEIIQQLKQRPHTITIGKNIHKKIAGTEITTEYVFCNSSGNVCSPRTWSRRHYDVFMQEMHDFYLKQNPPIDIPILNPHELRHTRTSLWVNEGKNLFAVASALGWNDLKMLRERYAHPDIESARKALDL